MVILDRIFGYANTRVLNALKAKVVSINELESRISKLSDEELKKKTEQFKQKLAQANGDKNLEKQMLEEILPEAFAVMREAMERVWGERHFDVQLMGGIVLHQGKIAEMKTGEGKTIVAALPLYLNALTGRGVHLVTVNDYLSKHQGEGMGEVYHFMGLSTGIIQSNFQSYRFVKKADYKHYSEAEGSNLEECSRREAYACDITYGTNNEFGFDYLRDNMVFRLLDKAQRELSYAIVDEVDSILIDEARTPLIISAQAEESTSLYQQFAALVPKLKIDDDYLVDEKDKVVTLTDAGVQKMEKMLGIANIYDSDRIAFVHHLEEALKAQALFQKDRDYIVKEGEIIIVDEFTGRLMVGRRYSEGLHQAIEAKEGVEVRHESQTLATISFQNYFRLYHKLAGMTGTAATEAEEFYKIYRLDVVEIPTNKNVVRLDAPDRIYKTEEAKYEAVVQEIKQRQEKGQPVLVGTVSVEKNERLAKFLDKAGVKHEVLNAKNHEREAKIVAKAGHKGAVTVATNMAGRGTDIKLGEGVIELGGLFVLGTERHEARRIDNQLRGRSGRQGDPGASQFYVSLEDDLMRIFGGDRIKSLMNTLGLPDDTPIENSIISRSIESAQKRVEGYNFDVRKHLVEYDDVINKHREVIYRKRHQILGRNEDIIAAGIKEEEESAEHQEGIWSPEIEKIKTLKAEMIEIISDQIDSILAAYVDDEEKASQELKALFGGAELPSLDREELLAEVEKKYRQKEEKFGFEAMREVEKAIYLRTIDMLWIEHLTTMDELRTGIGLRGYSQRDPLVEYKQEAYRLFQGLLQSIEATVARTILKVEVRVEPVSLVQQEKLEYQAPDPNDIGGVEDEAELAKEAEESDRIIKRVAKKEAQKAELKGEQSSKLRTNAGQSDVSVKVRYGGKTVFDRMKESASGPVGTYRGTSPFVKATGDDGKAVKVGRNDPCPCGSGKKYKKCHGK